MIELTLRRKSPSESGKLFATLSSVHEAHKLPTRARRKKHTTSINSKLNLNSTKLLMPTSNNDTKSTTHFKSPSTLLSKQLLLLLSLIATASVYLLFVCTCVVSIEIIGGDEYDLSSSSSSSPLLSSNQQIAARLSSAPASSPSFANELNAVRTPPFVSENESRVRGSRRISGKLKQHRTLRRMRKRRNRHQRLGTAARFALRATTSQDELLLGNNAPKALTALESIVEEVARAQQEATRSSSSSDSAFPNVSVDDLMIGQSTHAPSSVMIGGGSGVLPAAAAAPPPMAPPVGPFSHSNNPRGKFLTKVFTRMMHTLNVTELATETREGLTSHASCMTCQVVVTMFMSPVYSKELFSTTLKYICSAFGLQTPRVCNGLINAFEDDLEYIRYHTKLKRDEICGVIFGYSCARNKRSSKLLWNITIPNYPSTAAIQLQQSTFPRPPFLDIPHSVRPQVNIQQQQNTNNNNNNNLGGLPMQPQTQQVGNDDLNAFIRPPSYDLDDDAPDVLFDMRTSPTLNSTTLLNSNKQQLKPSINLDVNQQTQSSNISSNVDKISRKSMLVHHQQQQQQKQHQHQHQQGVHLEARSESALVRRASKSTLAPPTRSDFVFDSSDESTSPTSLTGNSNNSKRKMSTFVHITDIHIDPHYQEGALAECRETLCCRASSFQAPKTGPETKLRRAGKWGDLGSCDLPVVTLKNTLERIRDNHPDAEYWIWTGDISPHDIWNITKAETLNDVRQVSRMIRSHAKVPVFPVIGNHEGHPVNDFSPPNIKGKFSMSWLYDTMAEEWKYWLPSSALATFRYAGYYMVKVRPGFRILAVNTNFCARLNAWSFYDSVDPADHLQWLADELLKAEQVGDKVHIIGHVPPDHRECTQAWLFNYINICDRFKDTILAQFYGHTHRDEFRIVYSMRNPQEPVSIQYIGPSLTPFVDNNPAYRVFHQDELGYLYNFDTYFFNLTQANKDPPFLPNWKLAYRVQQDYNMTQGLTPADWHIYLDKIEKDDALFNEFHKNFYRSSDTKVNKKCSESCKAGHLHELRVQHPFKTEPFHLDPNHRLKEKGSRGNKSHHHRHHNHRHHRNPKASVRMLAT